jgi:hypothetical protein
MEKTCHPAAQNGNGFRTGLGVILLLLPLCSTQARELVESSRDVYAQDRVMFRNKDVGLRQESSKKKEE